MKDWMQISAQLWAVAGILQSLEFLFLKSPLTRKGFQRALNVFLLLGFLTFGFYPAPWLALVMLIAHLARLFLWRGVFNGGSDYMMTTLGVGHAMTLWDPRAGCLYVAVQVLLSYMVAGIVKFKNRDWRSGAALGKFINLPIFIKDNRAIHQIISWGLIGFELSVPLLVWNRLGLRIAAVSAVFFHLLVAIKMGLNRFFWVWLAAWPCVFGAFEFLRTRNF